MALMINISCSRRVKWKVVVVNTNTFRIKKLALWKNDPTICELDHVWLFILELTYQTLWDGLCPVLPGIMTSWHGKVFRITGPFHDDVIKWKHFPRHWPFVRGIHGSLGLLICARINGWVNNREAGDLRRRCTHYDVIVMCKESNGHEWRTYPFVCSANSHQYCNGFILCLVVIFIGSTSMQLMSVTFVSETIQVKTNSYELMLRFMDRRFIQYANTRYNSGCVFFATDWSLRPNSLSWYCLGGPGGWQVKRLEWLENWFSCCKAIFSSGVPAVFEC